MAEEPGHATTGTTLTEDDLAFIAAGREQLERFLSENPAGQEQLCGVLSKHLEGQLDAATTWYPMYTSLRLLVGEAGANFIAWSAMSEPARVDEIALTVPSAIAALIRRITATYGPEIKRVYESAGESPNNWRFINRDVYFDLLNNRTQIKITIEQYSGERVVIEGPPDSILGLTKNLIMAMRVVGSRQEFSDARVQDYLAETGSFLELLQPEVDGRPAVNGPSTEVSEPSTPPPAAP